MIGDAQDIPEGTKLTCDLCIIGGGPAGVTLALELAATGRHIVLLAGGGRRESAADRDLYRGGAAPAGSHEPLEENRRRMWGGASSAWGGRCIPFDPVDFAARPWIPHSGWPITAAELAPYFTRATALCEAGDNAYLADRVFPDHPAEMITGFDGEEVVTQPLERWGPPTHFGRRYDAELRAATNVQVLLNGHATHLELDAQGGVITRVDAASEPGHAFTVEARQYVLACGGLENARLLLASNDVAVSGIGNHSDCVGRFYMSHLFGVFAKARLRDTGDSFIYDFERDREGVYCRRRFWITPRAQEQCGIGNGIAFFFRPSLGEALHRDALFSATYLAKFFLGSRLRRGLRYQLARARANRAALLQHVRIVLADAPGLIPQIFRVIRARWFSRRRLPFVLPPKTSPEFYLFFQTEHLPNPESRLVLCPERDAFGMPRLEARIAFTELDIETVVKLHRVIRDRFAASGTGELIYDEAALRAHLRHSVEAFNSNAHQIGTTRMSRDPEHGVVDADCRVHGVANLFIAGSSVFPTSGHANPTLTLVALAVRLAAHLKTTPPVK